MKDTFHDCRNSESNIDWVVIYEEKATKRLRYKLLCCDKHAMEEYDRIKKDGDFFLYMGKSLCQIMCIG